MGKILLVLLALGIAAPAMAGARIQTRLPSETKKTHVKTKKQRKAPTAAPLRAPAPARAPAEEPIEKSINADDPFSTRITTRTVHFWRSPARLPASYHCDEEINGQKILEAEQKALDQCQSRGLEECHVQKVRIVKSGVLKCGDLMGNNCRPREHFAGCVAEAVVVGRN